MWSIKVILVGRETGSNRFPPPPLVFDPVCIRNEPSDDASFDKHILSRLPTNSLFIYLCTSVCSIKTILFTSVGII